MKKYYCPVCNKLKSRWQVKLKDDTRSFFYECRYCHSERIYLVEDILEIIFRNVDLKKEISRRYGSW